jgi:hypothetical protein
LYIRTAKAIDVQPKTPKECDQMPQQINKVKMRKTNNELRYVCDCGSPLVEQEEQLAHDQYERIPTEAGQPVRFDESKPLTCKWAGARFEIPTVDLKQIQA